jgi:hypothetical protein
MSPKDFTRFLFEAVIVLALGVLGFMELAVYNAHVIDQQENLIRQMQENPDCMNTGGNHG